MFKMMHILVKTPTALTLDLFAILNAPFTNHVLGINIIASNENSSHFPVRVENLKIKNTEVITVW